MSFADLEAGRTVVPLGRRDINLTIDGNINPSQAVASGIFQINTAVATFWRLLYAIGTPKDTPQHRQKLHKTGLHITRLVKDTSAKLKQASDLDHHADISEKQKIIEAKLAKDFQAVLTDFQKAQNLAADKEVKFAPFVPQVVQSSSYPESELDERENKEQYSLLVDSRRQGQQILLFENEIAFNEAIIEERDEGIQEIQRQIGEVNEIFKDLAVLVHDQGIMIGATDIQTHVENTNVATTEANSQLAKASKTQKSNTSLTCLLLLIFGVILLILIVVFAA